MLKVDGAWGVSLVTQVRDSAGARLSQQLLLKRVSLGTVTRDATADVG